MSSVILVTGAGSGIGRLSAEALARAGHTVYASMRGIDGRNSDRALEMRAAAERGGYDLRPLELDVLSQPSADAAVATIIAEQGGIDRRVSPSRPRSAASTTITTGAIPRSLRRRYAPPCATWRKRPTRGSAIPSGRCSSRCARVRRCPCRA